MAKDELADFDPESATGFRYPKRVFAILERLAPVGCERDTAGNRELLSSHYAGSIVLVLTAGAFVIERARKLKRAQQTSHAYLNHPHGPRKTNRALSWQSAVRNAALGLAGSTAAT